MAPFKPTPPRILRLLARVLADVASAAGERQPVLYEAGCGLAPVSRMASRRHGYYSVCVEVDPGLAAQARLLAERSRVGHLVDVVEGDVLSFSARRVTAAYAYLMPAPMGRLAELLPRDSVLLALDYPSPSMPVLGYWEEGAHVLYMQARLLPASLNASSAAAVHQSSPRRRSVSGSGMPSSAS